MTDPFAAWMGDEPSSTRKPLEIGWLLNTQKARFVWDTPKRVRTEETQARMPKSAANCPAVLDHDARLFEVPCPWDLRLGFQQSPDGGMVLGDLDGERSSVRPNVLGEHVVMAERHEWRHPDRPMIQINTPYVFLADEPAQLVQTPPYNHFNPEPWPGLMVNGRLPVHIWPRQMMWAFEWWDVKKPIIFKRGMPWFYLRFEGMDPTRPVRLVEAELTPALDEYLKGLVSVAGHVNRTYSLFKIAQERRPSTLLTRKSR